MPPHQAAQSHAERGAQRNTSSPSPKRSCCLQATGVQPGSDSGGTCAQRRRGAHAGGVRRHGAHAARAPATAAGARLARLQRRQHRHARPRQPARAAQHGVRPSTRAPLGQAQRASPAALVRAGPAAAPTARDVAQHQIRPVDLREARPAETDGGALRARRPAQQRAEPARRAQMSPQQVPTNFAVTLLWPCVRIRRARGTPHTHLRVQPRSLGRVAGGPRRTPPPDDAEDQQRKRRAVLVAGAHAPQALEGGNECEGPAARSHQKGCRARRAANRRRGGSPAPRAALRAPAGGTHRAKAPWGRCAESNSQVSRGPPCAHPRVNIAGMARRRGGAPLAPGAVRSHRGPAPALGRGTARRAGANRPILAGCQQDLPGQVCDGPGQRARQPSQGKPFTPQQLPHARPASPASARLARTLAACCGRPHTGIASRLGTQKSGLQFGHTL